MNVEIIRVEQGPSGTFGVLKINGECVCLTLERPWEDNKPNASCIPSGVYKCKRVVSPRVGSTFEVKDVPGRSHILFHTGNTIHDTEGCILLGSQFGMIWCSSDYRHRRGIKYSCAAFANFNERIEDVNEFTLTIREAVLNS